MEYNYCIDIVVIVYKWVVLNVVERGRVWGIFLFFCIVFLVCLGIFLYKSWFRLFSIRWID